MGEYKKMCQDITREDKIPVPPTLPNPYLSYGDTLRILACTFVVLIHVSEPFIKEFDSISRGDWWFCNGIVSLSRSAVPLFLMLSGALLLHPAKIEPVQVFYRKRLHRIGIPLLFWSIFYMAHEAMYGKAGLTILKALKKIALGLTTAHLYFLFAIAGLYLLTPVIWIYLKQATRRELLFGIVLLFIILVGGNMAASFAHFGWLGVTAFTRFVPYLGYFLVGYYLRDMILSRKAFLATCLVCIGSIAATMLGTYVLFFQLDIGRQMELFLPLSPTILITTITLFLIISNLVRRQERPNVGKRNIVPTLASATMGVYLIHYWFAERAHALGWMDWLDWLDRVWLSVLLATFIILGISYSLTFFLGRVPYVRRIVGL